MIKRNDTLWSSSFSQKKSKYKDVKYFSLKVLTDCFDLQVIFWPWFMKQNISVDNLYLPYIFLFFALVSEDECSTDYDCTSNPTLNVCETGSTPNRCVGKSLFSRIPRLKTHQSNLLKKTTNTVRLGPKNLRNPIKPKRIIGNLKSHKTP